MGLQETKMKYVDIVFTNPPGPDGCEFIEVEDPQRRSISFGTWVKRDDGLTALRLNLRSGDNNDVLAFQEKFNIPMSTKPAFLDGQAENYRVKFMQEELEEFIQASHEQDLAKAADALVDLVYVVHGTALMMGLPWDKLWNEVQRANMSKVRAKADGSDSKRGSPLDVIKPPGWVGPNHYPALKEAIITGSYFDTTTRRFV
jgi:predicted HAD superfamily Cof-like phosphohydrolase